MKDIVKQNKGFTLIELLAVVAILGILIVIILPNILKMFNEGKVNSFIVNAKKLMKSAEDQYIFESMTDSTDGEYCYTDKGILGKNLSNDKNIYYKVIIENGKTTLFQVTDGNYYIDKSGNNLKQKDLEEASNGKIEINCEGKNYLSNAALGSYVVYNGTNGCTGNACNGETANWNGTNGYCKFDDAITTLTGWRIAYKENGNVHLISAGAPECTDLEVDWEQEIPQITNFSTTALKYCNPTFIDGGVCSSANTWPMEEKDFMKINIQFSGSSKILRDCDHEQEDLECGYTNNLINNRIYYWIYKPLTMEFHAIYKWEPILQGLGWVVEMSLVNEGLGLRPVIKLSNKVYITGGSGTISDPYRIAK